MFTWKIAIKTERESKSEEDRGHSSASH